MTPLTVLKLTLAVAGIALFGYGVRADSATIRWVGVGFVAVAALLRFVRPRPTS